MTGEPRELNGRAALAEIVERLAALGGERQKAQEAGPSRNGSYNLQTPLDRRFDKMGRRIGTAANKSAGLLVEPLIDVYVNRGEIVVTTETEDAATRTSIEGRSLKITASRAAERVIVLPCAVKPASLRVKIINGILEATMRVEGAGQ